MVSASGLGLGVSASGSGGCLPQLPGQTPPPGQTYPVVAGRYCFHRHASFILSTRVSFWVLGSASGCTPLDTPEHTHLTYTHTHWTQALHTHTHTHTHHTHRERTRHPLDTSPDTNTPRHTSHGQQAGGTHPTGMLSCFLVSFY